MVKLVCQGADAPVAIASGGRYDALVQRFSPEGAAASGVDSALPLRRCANCWSKPINCPRQDGELVLVAYSQPSGLHPALNCWSSCTRSGQSAELWPEPCANQEEAQRIATQRGGATVRWVG